MTKWQVVALYYFYAKEKIEDLDIMAKLHGAKPKKGTTTSSSQDGEGTHKEIKEDLMLFRDPKSYEKLNKEQRVELTKKMLGMHKGIQFLGGGHG